MEKGSSDTSLTLLAAAAADAPSLAREAETLFLPPIAFVRADDVDPFVVGTSGAQVVSMMSDAHERELTSLVAFVALAVGSR